jgi:ABC-2 type transport system ATP-binding protein
VALSNSGGIRVESLTKNYGPLVALSNVSLDVGSGEVVGLIGPNGAGKSTLMKIVVGILRPTSGTVKVGGHDVVSEPEKAKRVIGYLPENPSLYTALTVHEFLRFVGKIRGVSDDALESRISSSIHDFALEDKVDALVGSLSKGMKQKVALSAAILHDPEVLILDEPHTALDPKTQGFVSEWIASQGKSGKTVLLSTHNLEVVQDFATRIVIIDRGTVIASGGLESLRKLADAKGDARLVEVFLKLTEDS